MFLIDNIIIITMSCNAPQVEQLAINDSKNCMELRKDITLFKCFVNDNY